jgi:hypothetical protein
MVGGGFDKSLPSFLGHFVGFVLLHLLVKPFMALVDVVRGDGNFLYRQADKRKIRPDQPILNWPP